MSHHPEPLSTETAVAILHRLYPGGTLVDVAALDEESNSTGLVTGQTTGGETVNLVVRRYAIFGNYDRGEKARREFRLFQLLQHSSVPVPEPLLLDDTGELLGSPGIVTRFVPGVQISAPENPLTWAASVASTLVDIHRVPVDAPEIDFLLDANSEALWFLNSESLPPYMAAHPRGADVMAAMCRLQPAVKAVPACLVHLDYWSGQFLWDGDRLAAVVDWEEVARGDPAVDVAYCRMDMFMNGLPDAGNEFLRVYEAAVGHKTANLGFWSLAAAVRPMFSGYGLEAPASAILSDFIDDALRLSGL